MVALIPVFIHCAYIIKLKGLIIKSRRFFILFIFYLSLLVTGSAGCKENHDEFGPQIDISAFRATDYGYTRMKAINATHLYLEQISDDKVVFY